MSRPHAWWCSGGPLCLCGTETHLTPGALESLLAWQRRRWPGLRSRLVMPGREVW